jgi:outer membrane murein-binding lipoprotein Lpp
MELEQSINRLKEEMSAGTREIDAINKDIAVAKEKITQIKRKHLNYFYYF